MNDKHDLIFATESYEAVERSRHPLLLSISTPWRNQITSWILAEWEPLRAVHSGRAQFEHSLRARVKQKVRNRVGFPWITLALFVANIIIKILIEYWFSDER